MTKDLYMSMSIYVYVYIYVCACACLYVPKSQISYGVYNDRVKKTQRNSKPGKIQISENQGATQSETAAELLLHLIYNLKINFRIPV